MSPTGRNEKYASSLCFILRWVLRGRNPLLLCLLLDCWKNRDVDVGRGGVCIKSILRVKWYETFPNVENYPTNRPWSDSSTVNSLLDFVYSLTRNIFGPLSRKFNLPHRHVSGTPSSHGSHEFFIVDPMTPTEHL